MNLCLIFSIHLIAVSVVGSDFVLYWLPIQCALHIYWAAYFIIMSYHYQNGVHVFWPTTWHSVWVWSSCDLLMLLLVFLVMLDNSDTLLLFFFFCWWFVLFPPPPLLFCPVSECSPVSYFSFSDFTQFHWLHMEYRASEALCHWAWFWAVIWPHLRSFWPSSSSATSSSGPVHSVSPLPCGWSSL